MMVSKLTKEMEKMSYLEKRVPYRTDGKKVASARVSEVVMTALSDASKDADILGYSFTVSKIIEKALNDTLAELREKTFIDYYKLVDWKRKMEQLQTELSYDGLTLFFDFDIEIVKLKEGMLATEDLESRDFDTILEMHEQRIFGAWNHNLLDLKIDVTVLSDGRIVQTDFKG